MNNDPQGQGLHQETSAADLRGSEHQSINSSARANKDVSSYMRDEHGEGQAAEQAISALL